MYKLVIGKAALTSRMILQDVIYKTPSGNTIEPPLMGSPSEGGHPFKSNASAVLVCSLQVRVETPLFLKNCFICHFLLFHMFYSFQNAFTIFHKNPLCMFWRGPPINLFYKRKHKLRRDKYQTQDQNQLNQVFVGQIQLWSLPAYFL